MPRMKFLLVLPITLPEIIRKQAIVMAKYGWKISALPRLTIIPTCDISNTRPTLKTIISIARRLLIIANFWGREMNHEINHNDRYYKGNRHYQDHEPFRRVVSRHAFKVILSGNGFRKSVIDDYPHDNDAARQAKIRASAVWIFFQFPFFLLSTN